MTDDKVQERIDAHVDKYFDRIVSGEWTRDYAYSVLGSFSDHALTLFEIAALAKALAIVECADDAGIDF